MSIANILILDDKLVEKQPVGWDSAHAVFYEQTLKRSVFRLLPCCRIVNSFFNCNHSGGLRHLGVSRINGLLCLAESAHPVTNIT